MRGDGRAVTARTVTTPVLSTPMSTSGHPLDQSERLGSGHVAGDPGLRRLARAALAHYGLERATLHRLRNAENVTYQVDAEDGHASEASGRGPYVSGRYLLRLHGEGYHTRAAIESECGWLAALRREVGLVVPVAVATPAGDVCVEVRAPGSPAMRYCSLLRWVRGRIHSFRPRPSPHDLARLGRLMAGLHAHAERWPPPPGFQRPRWDWDGLFGNGTGFGTMTPTWAVVPDRYRSLFRRVADGLARVMRRLGDGPDVFGLIHADLNFENIVVTGGHAHAIDFDDCGHGYWAYDVAAALVPWWTSDRWPAVLDAFLAGYTSLRAAPRGLEDLDLFMGGRHVAIALWAMSRASRNAVIRRELARRFRNTARCIRLLPRCGETL